MIIIYNSTGRHGTGVAHFTLTDICRRGWTDRLIKNVLGPPDDFLPNPHCDACPQMQLWRADRVEAAELDPEYMIRPAKPRRKLQTV